MYTYVRVLNNCFHHLVLDYSYAIMPPFVPSYALDSIFHLVCNRVRLYIAHPDLKRFALLIIDHICPEAC